MQRYSTYEDPRDHLGRSSEYFFRCAACFLSNDSATRNSHFPAESERNQELRAIPLIRDYKLTTASAARASAGCPVIALDLFRNYKVTTLQCSLSLFERDETRRFIRIIAIRRRDSPSQSRDSPYNRIAVAELRVRDNLYANLYALNNDVRRCLPTRPAGGAQRLNRCERRRYIADIQLSLPQLSVSCIRGEFVSVLGGSAATTCYVVRLLLLTISLALSGARARARGPCNARTVLSRVTLCGCRLFGNEFLEEFALGGLSATNILGCFI